MRLSYGLLPVAVCAGIIAAFTASGAAQGTARGAAAAPAATRSAMPVFASLAQLMRGIPFPSSNIVFDVQDNDPAKKKPDPNGPFIGQYQGWEGVENAGLALAESATLVLFPGRKCSNGKTVPVQAPEFRKYALALRTTGMAIYSAARKKDQSAVSNLSDNLTETCANCHDKYRPDSRIGGSKVGVEARCAP